MPTTIKLGDSGDDVKRLQRVFARTKVLEPDSVTGVFGPETEQAVKDFQQSNGLVAASSARSHGATSTRTVRRRPQSRPAPSGRWWL